MKKILGLVTAIGLIGGTVPAVVACNTQKAEDSFYKKSLKLSINRAEEVIVISPNKNSERIKPLKDSLSFAKDKYQQRSVQEDEYITTKKKLDTELNEFQYPGYKGTKKALEEEIEDTESTIARDPDIKLPEIIKGVKNALIDAKIVLYEEVDPSIIKLTIKNLEYWHKAYYLNRTDNLGWGKQLIA